MNRFVPHAVVLPASPSNIAVSQISVSEDFGFETFVNKATSEIFPGFTGIHRQNPRFTIQTPDCQSVLEQIDTQGVAKGYTAETPGNQVVLEYLGRQNLGANWATSNTSNQRIILQRSMMCWSTLSASNASLADLGFMLYPEAGSSDEAAISRSSAALTATAVTNKVFTLGPVSLNGVTICAESINWSNNPAVNPYFCNGLPWPSLVVLESVEPTVEITTEESDKVLGYLAGGAISSLTIYLRAKVQGGDNYSDASEEHIKIVASVGLITANGRGGLTLRVHGFTVTTDQAIT